MKTGEMFNKFVVFLILTSSISVFCRDERSSDRKEFFESVFHDIVSDAIDSIGDFISIPDIKEQLGYSFLKVKMDAVGGSLGNLSTLTIQNVSVSSDSDRILVRSQIHLDRLQVVYDYFGLSLTGFSVDGNVSVKVSKNLLDFGVKIILTEDKCQVVAEVDDLREFSGLTIKIANLGNSKIERIANNFIQAVASRYENEIHWIAGLLILDIIKDITNNLQQIVCGDFN